MQSFLIKIQGEIEFECLASETITSALQRQGIKAIAPGCRQGGCGACRVKIVEGKVEHGHLNSIVISAQEIKEGMTLACQSKPLSDLLLLPEKEIL